MGTTLTAVRSLGRDLMIAHVELAGLCSAGERCAVRHAITRLARLLVRTSVNSPRATSPVRPVHLLTNALGGSITDVQVDTDRLRLKMAIYGLLCSDGLSDMVDDGTLAEFLEGSARSSDACERLVQQALDGGRRDNVTVIVAAYRIQDDAARTRLAENGGEADTQAAITSLLKRHRGRCGPWRP